jgi:hypothetical protein
MVADFMGADSMAQVLDGVVKVCPLLTWSAFNPSQTAGPPPKGDQAGGFFLFTLARNPPANGAIHRATLGR